MIIDLDRFIREEQPYWNELESLLAMLETRTGVAMDLAQAKRFHYLYKRSASDLARFRTFATEPAILGYLDALVSRAYGEIHEVRDTPHRLHVLTWFFVTFPRTFRRRRRAFHVSLGVTLVGVLFGAAVLVLDRDSKGVLLPFEHLRGDPSERVAREESVEEDALEGRKASFSATLMTHNTKVSIFTLALGMTWGFGTIVLLFYNGVILGAVTLDYVLASESTFLVGWLLPHGSIEIPAILIAGQAGLVLGNALIGQHSALSLRARLRGIAPDLVTLIFGVAILLVWAGIVEAFFSQYHEPFVPYWLKIAFGALELTLLCLFLTRSGLAREHSETNELGATRSEGA